jgi:hypothetical protein
MMSGSQQAPKKYWLSDLKSLEAFFPALSVLCIAAQKAALLSLKKNLLNWVSL